MIISITIDKFNMQINDQQYVFNSVTKPSIFYRVSSEENNMASKQVATTAGAMLSAAGRPKIFTDAKGRQFMVLK